MGYTGSFWDLTRMIRERIFILAAGLFCLVLVIDVSGQRNSVGERRVSMKTYPYSDPNPLPAMAINNKVAPFYPYNTFDGYTDKGIQKEWKVIEMENPYIRVMVQPEVGGKVMGAIEKSTGKEFVYINHVMKFRSIGIRGPWTSGGIEHNFGLDLGHAPWASGPVDYRIIQNADGSSSCIVGGLDLASRTEWRVNIHLPKDKAYFETRALWFNPTPFHEAYLSWENAAYKATDDLEFYFPGTHHVEHSGIASPWPIDQEGRNLSLYRENNFGSHKSYHVVGDVRNWFGGYWRDSGFGFGHWAPYADAPGKKLWIWSLSRNGAIWEDLLTDDDGQYIEAQSGVKFNQAGEKSGFHTPFTQLSFRPFYAETKTDYWFPVKGTGGMADATPDGTLNVTASGHGVKIMISPNVSISDTLTVSLGDKSVHREYLQLKPMEVFEKEIPVIHGPEEILRVHVGNKKLYYTSDKTENVVSRPMVNTFETEYRSADRLYRLGNEEHAMRNYDAAEKFFRACLEAAPTHSRALTRLAELSYRKQSYEQGKDLARKVLQLDTYDGGANFIYGVILAETGDLNNAEEAFAVAGRTMEFRSAAYVQIARINMRKGNLDQVIQYATSALEYNKYNLTAHHILSTAYRKANDRARALEVVETLLGIDPLSHYARFELYLLNPDDKHLADFKSAITNEFPHETFLELAVEYANAGLSREAAQVLSEAPEHPTVYYWRAYFERDRDQAKSMAYLKRALELSPEQVFPFRSEDIPVLTWAQAQQPSWKTMYYLGLVYWNHSNTDQAKALFLQCGGMPDYAPFYLARYILFQGDKDAAPQLLPDLKRAVSVGPAEWRTWHYLNNYYQGSQFSKEGLENAGKAFKRFPNNPVIGMDYAKALLQNGNFKGALNVLDQIRILPQEGAREGQDIYELANLASALKMMESKKYEKALQHIEASRQWPEHLGAGKPYDPDTRLQDMMAAVCEEALSGDDTAAPYYRRIEKYSLDRERRHSGEPLGNYIGFMVMKKNRNPKLDALIKEWQASNDSIRNWGIGAGSLSAEFQWVLAKIEDDEKKTEELEEKLLSHARVSRLRLFLDLMRLREEME